MQLVDPDWHDVFGVSALSYFESTGCDIEPIHEAIMMLEDAEDA